MTRNVLLSVGCLLALGCGGKAAPGAVVAAPAADVPTVSQPAAAPVTAKPSAPLGPTGERAQALREAAELLEKAGAALGSGNRNLAEQLFSTAELITGPETLVALAPLFREGAPPRVMAPVRKVEKAATAQPRTVGGSEADDAEAKVEVVKQATGALVGVVQVDGRPAPGAFGLVTLEPIGRKVRARSPKRQIVEQRKREFLPHVLAVPVGSTVEFPNHDQVFHNVFSTSPTAPFDLGLYRGDESRDVTFAKEGILRIGCNLHANMSAYIAVVAAPHYVITDETGKYTFNHLLPGKYRLRAWHERTRTPVTMEVTVKPGTNDVNIGVTGDAPAGPQPDKFGVTRG